MARYKFGNTGVSSLVSSATSAFNKQQTLNDQEQAFTFEFGPQDQAAHDAYQKYLNGRIASTANLDPSTSLSLQRKSIEATRTFRTNQIQQASIDVQEGNAAPEDKVNLLKNLAQAAYANGDVQSGQSIEAQYNSAIIALQNHNQALQSQAEAGFTKAQNEVAKSYSADASALKLSLAKLDNFFQHGKDDNGKKFTQEDYVKQASPYYQALNNLYGEARNNSGLSEAQQAKFDLNLQDFQKSKDYNVLGNPDAIARLGDGTLVSKTDVHTGLKKLDFAKVVGQTVGEDGQLHNITEYNNPNQITPGKNGEPGTFYAQKPGSIEGQNVFSTNPADPSKGTLYYIDATTGKKIQVDSKTGQEAIYDPKHPDQAPLSAPAVAEAPGPGILDLGNTGKYWGDVGKSVANTAGSIFNLNKSVSPLGRGINSVVSNVTNPIGGAINFLSNTLGFNTAQAQAKAAAQARLDKFNAATAAAIQQVKSQQAQIAAQGAQAPIGSKAYIPPQTPQPAPNRYNPTNPTQLLYPKPSSDPQIAANIGNATGYKPF